MTAVSVVDDQDDPLPATAYRDLIAGVLAAEGLPDGTQADLHLVRSDRIAGLNEAHLGRTGPTDVLSFPIEDLVPGAAAADAGGAPLHLGDVVVCPAYVRDSAGRRGVAFAAEMALLVVHGTLHLLGYDHESDDDAELMEARERALLAALAPVPPVVPTPAGPVGPASRGS